MSDEQLWDEYCEMRQGDVDRAAYESEADMYGDEDFAWEGGLWDADPDVCCAAFQLGACVHTESGDPWDAEFENVPGVDPGVLDTGWDTLCGYCGKHPTHGPSNPDVKCEYTPTPLMQLIQNGGVVFFDEVDPF